MTVAWKDGECWLPADGAPAGPSFAFTIPSSRKGHGPYRITRDAVSGYLLHQPPCEAWEHGHMNCRHITEAIRRAEQPAEHFLASVATLRAQMVWWTTIDEARAFCVAVIRLMEEALEAKEQIAQAARLADRAPVTEAEVAEFFGDPA